MAGIAISSDGTWIVAGWVYGYLVDGLAGLLSDDCRAMDRLRGGVQNGLYFAWLDDLSVEERRQFFRAVCQLREGLHATKREAFSPPEAHTGLGSRMGELIDLMERDWADATD